MNNKKSTKRALLSSVLSLVLCMTMLIGTTFAWFTDSVTSTGNIIKSGKLDVELNYKSKLADNWASVTDEEEAIFNYDKWEPGYVDVKYIQVANVGNLAFKYLLNIIPETIVAEGEADLADVIDVYIVKNPKAEITRDSLATMTKVGTLSSLMADPDGVARGILLPTKGSDDVELAEEDAALAEKEQVTLGIALKMQESAGNEYQDLTVGEGFDIQLLATQYTWENDSFDNQYDVNAAYPGEIKSLSDLTAALKQGGNFKLENDIAIPTGETLNIPADVAVALDLNGKKISGDNTKDTGALVTNNGTLTIVGGDMTNTAVNGAYVIDNKGTLVLDGANVVGAPMTDAGYPAYAINSTGDITIEDGTTVTSDRGALYVEGGKAVINGGTFVTTDAANTRPTVLTLHTVVGYEGSNLTINGGKFENNYTVATGSSVICPWGGTINIYGGDFKDAVDSTANFNNTANFQNYMGYAKPNVYGGTFDDSTVLKNVATGSIAIQNADGTYTVVDVSDKTKVDDGLYTDAAGEYYVYNAEGLSGLKSWMDSHSNNAFWGKTYNLMADIDASDMTWTTKFISPDSTTFDGITFNGNGFTIKNLTINGQGMFSGATQGSDSTVPAVFKDVTFDNVTVNGGSHHNGVVWGEAYGDITVDNVHVINSTITGGCNVGALIGRNFDPSTIKFIDCSVKNTTVNATQAADYAGASAFLGMALEIGNTTSINLIFEGKNVAEGNTLNTATGMQGGGIYTIATWGETTWETPTVVDEFTNYNSNN